MFDWLDASGGFELRHSNPGSQKVALDTYNGATPNTIISTNSLSPGWHTIGFTRDGTTTTLYVDGAFVGSAVCTLTAAASTSCRIGRRISGVQPWLGGMSSVVLDNNRVWSAAQMLAYHQFGLLPGSATGVYRLNEGAGATAYDTSGNANNGTISGDGYFSSVVPFKKRQQVGGNLVYNGDFEYAPPVNVAQTGSNKWIDGSAAGSSTNYLFGWGLFTTVGGTAALFDSSTSHSGSYSLKVSTTTTGALAQVFNGLNTSWISPIYPSTIPLLPNTSYILTYWMKTQLNSGSANTGAQVIFSERNGSGSQVGVHNGTGIVTTTGWTKYTITATTTSTTAFALIKLAVTGNDGANTLILDAWFDNIYLQQTTVPTRGVVV